MMEWYRRWRWNVTVKRAQKALRIVYARMAAAGLNRQQRRQVLNDLIHERRPNL